jgi:hypothetical protein
MAFPPNRIKSYNCGRAGYFSTTEVALRSSAGVGGQALALFSAANPLLLTLKTLPLHFIDVTDKLDPSSWQRFVRDIIGIEVECLTDAT